jgi:hypothetical protein
MESEKLKIDADIDAFKMQFLEDCEETRGNLHEILDKRFL